MRKVKRWAALLAVVGIFTVLLTFIGNGDASKTFLIERVDGDGALMVNNIQVGHLMRTGQGECDLVAGFSLLFGTAACILDECIHGDGQVHLRSKLSYCPAITIPTELLDGGKDHVDARDAFTRIYLAPTSCTNVKEPDTLSAVFQLEHPGAAAEAVIERVDVAELSTSDGVECRVRAWLTEPPPRSLPIKQLAVIADDATRIVDAGDPLTSVRSWWLCATLAHQRYYTDGIEAVMFADPLRAAPVSHPFSFSAPRASLSRSMALKAREFLSSSSPSDRTDVDSVLLIAPPNGLSFTSRVSLSSWHSSTPSKRIPSIIDVHFSFNGTEAHINNVSARAEHRVVFVTAIGGREDRLREQLKQHAVNAARGSSNFAICLADFVDVNTYNATHMAQSLLPPTVGLIIASQRGVFMKTFGLTACLSLLHDDDIAFILDVDMEIDFDLANEIRRHVVRGRSIYGPIVHFDLVDRRGESFEGPVGWATMGTGLLGAYVSDMRSVAGGAYDTLTFRDAHGWEDTDYFFRMRQSGLAIIRPRESRLAHMPHPRGGVWAGKSTSHRSNDAFACPDRPALFRKAAHASRDTDPLLSRDARGLCRAAGRSVLVWVQRGETVAVERVGREGRAVACDDVSFAMMAVWEEGWARSSMPAVPGREAEAALAAPRHGDTHYFMSLRTPSKGDVWEAGGTPLCDVKAVRVRTGHADHVGKVLQSGRMTVTWTDGNEEVVGFKNGAAIVFVDSGRCVKMVKLEVDEGQRMLLVIQPIEIIA